MVFRYSWAVYGSEYVYEVAPLSRQVVWQEQDKWEDERDMVVFSLKRMQLSLGSKPLGRKRTQGPSSNGGGATAWRGTGEQAQD